MQTGEAVRVVRAHEKARNVVYLSGPPGIGKSAIVKQMCAEDKVQCVDIRLSLLNPVDLRGIPIVQGDKVVWVPPVFLVKMGPCRFFLDELPNATPTTMNSALQWILDKRIGEWEMDTTWEPSAKRERQTIIAAGNRATDQAFVHQMSAPLRNRMAHIEVEPDLSNWKDWALANRVSPLVINFLTFTANVGVGINEKSKYGLLFFFDPKQHAQSQFPTPRSWESVSRFITENPELRTNVEAIAGLVGVAVASKFAAFVKVADQLPDAEAILKGKSKAAPPTSPDAAYAFSGALTAALIRTKDKNDRIEATKVIAAYCAEHWSRNAEFAVLTLKDFGRTQEYRDIYRSVIVTKEWKLFTQTFGEMME